MAIGGRHVTSIKEREDLQQAKATILLQRKQINNYEKLIKKQNDKIRSLRQFILRHHGKDSLENVESSSAPTTTTDTDTPTTAQDDSKSVSGRTDNITNNSRHSISSEDKMINIRLGIDSINSFFFSRSDNTRPAVIRHLQSPPADQRLPVSSATSSSSSSQTTASSPHVTPERPATATAATAVSPFTDEHWHPTITSSPIWKQEHRKPTTSTNHATNKRRLSRDAVWETLCSPSPDQHQDVAASTLALGHSLLHGHGSPPASSSHGQRPSRHILTPVCDNQSSVARTTMNRKRPNSHFIPDSTSSSDGFPYAEVVRNKQERSKLHGTSCTCCEKYFDTNDTHERLQRYSRHRERFLKPKTPPGYWDLDFPDSPHQ